MVDNWHYLEEECKKKLLEEKNRFELSETEIDAEPGGCPSRGLFGVKFKKIKEIY